MTKCKLVPAEPTPEMLEAGADWCGQGLGADEAKGRSVTACKAMLAAAPAVQGEPVSHDWDDQDKCRRCGDRDWYALATCTPKQQPAPDVQGLVEALTELCDEIDKHEIHAAISKTSILWFKRKARKALAAHRKQGG